MQNKRENRERRLNGRKQRRKYNGWIRPCSSLKYREGKELDDYIQEQEQLIEKAADINNKPKNTTSRILLWM